MNHHLTKFQRRNDLHKALFWWVLSKRDSFHTASVNQCIDTFYKAQKIDPEKFPKETARSIFERMHKEFMLEESSILQNELGYEKGKESGKTAG